MCFFCPTCPVFFFFLFSSHFLVLSCPLWDKYLLPFYVSLYIRLEVVSFTTISTIKDHRVCSPWTIQTSPPFDSTGALPVFSVIVSMNFNSVFKNPQAIITTIKFSARHLDRLVHLPFLQLFGPFCSIELPPGIIFPAQRRSSSILF